MASAHIEIHPVDTPSTKPPSLRPHYIKEVAADGRVVWVGEPYYDRATARKAVKGFGLPVVEFDADGNERPRRTYTRDAS